ncbi:MAG: hypothetical protein ACYS0K_23860, partial [Planctomycetota bacterium]
LAANRRVRRQELLAGGLKKRVKLRVARCELSRRKLLAQNSWREPYDVSVSFDDEGNPVASKNPVGPLAKLLLTRLTLEPEMAVTKERVEAAFAGLGHVAMDEL